MYVDARTYLAGLLAFEDKVSMAHSLETRVPLLDNELVDFVLDVPFDVTRNLALTLSGTGVFDVMTYCGTPNNTWPMPVRWSRLWNEIG